MTTGKKILNFAADFFKRLISAAMTLIIIVGFAIIGLYIYGIRPYVVLSGSMEPAVHVGSVCFVDRRVPYEDIVANDIISFRAGEDILVTHRAVGVLSDGIVTKGDANDVNDAALVTRENYIGKTLFSIPKAGYFIKALRTGKGRIVCAALIIWLLIRGTILSEKE